MSKAGNRLLWAFVVVFGITVAWICWQGWKLTFPPSDVKMRRSAKVITSDIDVRSFTQINGLIIDGFKNPDAPDVEIDMLHGLYDSIIVRDGDKVLFKWERGE